MALVFGFFTLFLITVEKVASNLEIMTDPLALGRYLIFIFGHQEEWVKSLNWNCTRGVARTEWANKLKLENRLHSWNKTVGLPGFAGAANTM